MHNAARKRLMSCVSWFALVMLGSVWRKHQHKLIEQRLLMGQSSGMYALLCASRLVCMQSDPRFMVFMAHLLAELPYKKMDELLQVSRVDMGNCSPSYVYNLLANSGIQQPRLTVAFIIERIAVALSRTCSVRHGFKSLFQRAAMQAHRRLGLHALVVLLRLFRF